MATYWLDPFLEATTQGNGTTDTSTQDGSYAAPFSLLSFRDTVSYNEVSAINGTTLADGDEVRLKGLPFSTLFESKGNVYHSGGAYNDTDGHLQPVTGNSSFDATISTTKSSLFAFQNSDISSYLPGWSHPLWFVSKYTSDSTNLYTTISPFLWAVLDEQLGYNSASSTGMELFRLKDTYANPIDMGSTQYFWWQMANKVKLTSGWTSTTAQDGYSIWEPFNSANYKYLYITNSSQCKTQFDLERCVCAYAPRADTGRYNDIKSQVFNCGRSTGRNEATDHVMFSFCSAHDRASSFYADMHDGSTTTYPLISGDYSSYRSQYLNIYAVNTENVASDSHTFTFKNIIAHNMLLYRPYTQCTLELGNTYCTSVDNNETGKNRAFYIQITTQNSGSKSPINYLQNSVYFMTREGSQSSPILLAAKPDLVGKQTYGSGLKKPGIAPLDNLTADTSITGAAYGPHSAGAVTDFTYLADTREVSTNNNWFTPHLSREGVNPIVYASLEKLICNSSNYKTTAHNITVERASPATDASGAPQYAIWSAEHNDFDGKPISIIGDPYTIGTSYGVLVYNDTVSSQSVLVAQWSGTTGGSSSQAWLPLELPVPSYNAGSDNLRVTVSAAYDNGGSGSAEKIKIKAHHRDATQTDKFRVYTSGDTTISSSNAASPTTATLNLTNVPTSGQEDITSVIVGIRLQFASNTNIQKFYITNAAIETY
jgi:hypothetical protein|tara:strand:+ start:966 stop:3098 length:2133 start_codon:yes stop_codon:yes gene_type:complete